MLLLAAAPGKVMFIRKVLGPGMLMHIPAVQVSDTTKA